MLFDFCVAPLLLWSKTRRFTLILAVLFQVCHLWVYGFSVLPLLMIASLMLFLPPDWARRHIAWQWGWVGARRQPVKTTAPSGLKLSQYGAFALICLYVLVQLMVPLRKFVYPGNVSWHRQGERLGWHMRLNHRTLHQPRFIVEISGEGFAREVDVQEILTRRQFVKMSANHDMILQVAHHIRDEHFNRGIDCMKVSAIAMVSLNGRSQLPLTDPKVNLADQPRTLKPMTWVPDLREIDQSRQANAETVDAS